MALGIDLSNLSGPITQEQVNVWLSQGVSFAIIGTQSIGIARQQWGQLSTVHREPYIFLYWLSDGEVMAQAGIDVLQGFGYSGRYWLDCEEDHVNPDGSITMSTSDQIHIIAVIDLTVKYLRNRGYNVGIYTRKDWWEKYTGNTDKFSSLPLWDANWDGNPDLTVNWYPYGGWLSRAVKQYGAGNPEDRDSW